MQLDTEVEQNNLSGSSVVPLKPTSTAMVVTGSLQGDMRNKSNKFAKNENVKESLVKQPPQQFTLGAINPLPKISSSEPSDNVNINLEDSPHFQQQEELHFVSCVQRQTETISNLTASKSNSIVLSQVTVSSHHMTESIATKVKSKSVSTGMSCCHTHKYSYIV